MGVEQHPWIGVDLDGTLAFYDHWVDETSIGAPIPKMVERVKRWIADGVDVRIVTARIHPDWPHLTLRRTVIESWCAAHLGKVLPITHEKDYNMVELWDDRCVQVIPNTGERVDGKP